MRLSFLFSHSCCYCCVILFLCTGRVLSADMTHEERSIAELVLKGSQISREGLKSGIYTVTGDRKVFSVKHTLDRVTSVELLCAFDYTNHLFRFERKEPSLNPKNRDKHGEIKLVGGKYIETSDTILHQSIGRDVVSVISLTRRDMYGVHPFDIRLIGFVNMFELSQWDTKQRNGSFYYRMFNENTGFLTLKNVVGVSSKNGLIYMLEWSMANGRGVRRIWFDSTKGYSPIRLEDRFNMARKGVKPNLSEPISFSTVHWKQIGKSWVPTEYIVENREYRNVVDGTVRYVPDPLEIQGYSLNFKWKNVNEEVSAELFTVEGIEKDFGKEMYLVDTRLEGNAIILKDPSLTSILSDDGPSDNRSKSLYLILLVNLVALVAGISVFVYWKYRSSKS